MMARNQQLIDKEFKSWFANHWRPAMAWAYLVICVFDFLGAPILTAVYAEWSKEFVFSAWDPLTIRGGGIFHIAMGAILGVTAWSRGQEKMRVMDHMFDKRRHRDRVPAESEEDFGEMSEDEPKDRTKRETE